MVQESNYGQENASDIITARWREPERTRSLCTDERIDFSDIPESTDGELKRARRVGRPKSRNTKQLIAIRIAPRLLAQLRRLAAKRDKPYQTLIHELLEKAARTSKVA